MPNARTIASESTDNHFVDNVGGDLVGRWPIGNSGVAPYIFGGGGRQFDPVIQWTWDAGGGIEWRFAPHVGVFLDGRFVWADDTKDYGLGRLGLRVGFLEKALECCSAGIFSGAFFWCHGN